LQDTRSEAEGRALVGPCERQLPGHHLLQREAGRLAPLGDGALDVGREEGERRELPDVGVRGGPGILQIPRMRQW
jgi:hypothetical protein